MITQGEKWNKSVVIEVYHFIRHVKFVIDKFISKIPSVVIQSMRR